MAGLLDPTGKTRDRAQDVIVAVRREIVAACSGFVKFAGVLMARLLPVSTLLALCLVAPILGCVAKPPEKPIVLRPAHPERRFAKPLSRRAPQPGRAPDAATADTSHSPHESDAPHASSEPLTAAPLTSDEKNDLFQSFESYLFHNGHAP